MSVLPSSTVIAWIFAATAGLALSFVPRRITRRFHPPIHFASRTPTRVVVIVFLVSIAISVSWAAFNGSPEPLIHDEQSRALQAKTFLLGRLTNPPHPMADFFETFHVLQHPTYQSKYPPADAGFFALGGLMTGRLITGSWIAVALACAAIAWMLAAWVPLRWALLGGLATAFHSAVLGWSESFMGGGAAMLGGALAVGGAVRVSRSFRSRDAAAMAVGIAILANTRPWEGLVLTVMTGCAFLIRTIRAGSWTRERLIRVALPLLCIGFATVAWMGWYDMAVTGHPLRLPYIEYQRTHSRMGLFVWNAENRDASARLPGEMLRHQQWELGLWRRYETGSGAARTAWNRIVFYFNEAARVARTTVPPPAWAPIERAFRYALLLPLLALPWVIARRRPGALALAGIVIFMIAELAAVAGGSHYIAPVAPLVALLFVDALRSLRAVHCRTVPLGRIAFNATLVILAVTMIPSSILWPPRFGSFLRRYANEKRAVETRLARRQGRDLVLVRYAPDHVVHAEIVYNGPDPDDQPVIWARDLGAKRDREIIDYYSDRRAWIFEPDADPPRLTPVAGTPEQRRAGTR